MRKRVFLLLCVVAAAVTAQNTPGTALTCQANVAVPPTIRSEGLTELVGDITLTCTGGTPVAPGVRVPTANISLFLNTAVTSRIATNGASEALLLIDEPGASSQVVAPASPAAGTSFTGSLTGDGTGLNFASGGIPNVYQGLPLNVNGVTFNNIPIPPPSDGGSRTFRITNVRANANGLFQGGSTQGNVTASISMTDSSSPFPTIFNARGVAVGPFKISLNPAVTTTSASQDFPFNFSLLGSNPSLPSNPGASVLSFSGTFPGAFGPNANTTTAGLADFGTRLKAVFTNIPSGVSVFVSTTNVAPQTPKDRPEPRAANAGSQATLESGGTAVGSTGLSKLTATNGSAAAIWNVTSVDPNVADTLNFNVYTAFNSGGTTATAPPAPTNIGVQMSYASGAGLSQFAGPPGSPQAVFTINEFQAPGTTTQLSASIDPRPCLIGAPYPDPGNACSPGNNPQIAILSDTAALTPSFSASTSGGVNITASLASGSTPVNGTLAVTAPNAAAGTYPQTLNITAPGAGNSLQLPYSVTVLPSTSPFIKPGGVVDAFSFAGGSIAAGQIFALFGSNFGPASGLVSGTVSAAGLVGTTVANTQVLFDGVAAPLLYVTQNQLAGVAPFEILGKTSTNVQVVYNTVKSPALAVPVSTASLSIASVDGTGGGGGVIINKDGSINSATNPASVGDEIVIYAAYAGPFANSVTGTDGRTTTGLPYPAPAGPVSVTIGGVQATNVPYFGNVPTLLESVMQINVVIPPGVPAGTGIPLTAAAGKATASGFVTIAVH